VEISSTVIRDSHGEISTISFIKDITDKKRMEEQLFQAEKLRALGEMASGVAHDFNNALAAILGNTQLLLFSARDDDISEKLQTIEKVARDSAQTVRRLQDFTRKKVHKEYQGLDVHEIIRDAMEITRPKWRDDAQGKGISIDVGYQPGEVPLVDGNASELREVLTNMIFNAVEAMPQGGRLDLQTFQRNGKIGIRIGDSGVGMTEETRKKIFDPFFTTKPFSNTGLGLSVSYGIIQQHGGTIEVNSRAGVGTVFTIFLPVGAREKAETPGAAGIPRGKTARILVVDDEETVRDILSKMLERVHHQVTVAENGEEGLRFFQEKEFDLVLTDLGMPGLSGWEVCRRIKEIKPRTPVGMITGWGMELSRASMEECGLNFLIPKPFEFRQILRIVNDAMENPGRHAVS
jgi:nitrogen-specific signal transduction histidine kinase/CheY-like chemotaxis protein